MHMPFCRFCRALVQIVFTYNRDFQNGTLGHVRQTKTKVSLRTAQSDQFSLSAVQTEASEGSDQTARMRRLI